jgi:perosamine synthetase
LDEARRARQANLATYRISPYGVNLPSALNLTAEMVGYVCTSLKEIFAEERMQPAL